MADVDRCRLARGPRISTPSRGNTVPKPSTAVFEICFPICGSGGVHGDIRCRPSGDCTGCYELASIGAKIAEIAIFTLSLCSRATLHRRLYQGIKTNFQGISGFSRNTQL